MHLSARDSSGILPMKLEFTPYFFLEINLISLGDTANGPTLSFFRMSLNICNKFIKMKGLRPNKKTHLLCRKCVASFCWCSITNQFKIIAGYSLLVLSPTKILFNHRLLLFVGVITNKNAGYQTVQPPSTFMLSPVT